MSGAVHTGAIVVHGITTVSGRYSFGDTPVYAGVNLYACRLNMIATDSLRATAPIIPPMGEMVQMRFDEFGDLQGPVIRRLEAGFEVSLLMSAPQRALHNRRINSFSEALWTGASDRRATQRLLPTNPRTVIARKQDDWPQPCLVIDYSGHGAAISAPFQPSLGEVVTIGEVEAKVVRHFELGFAVSFAETLSTQQAEKALEAPQEWRHALLRAFPTF